MRKSRRLKIIFSLLFACFIGLSALILFIRLTSIENELSPTSIELIQSFGLDSICANRVADFQSQVACIRAAKKIVDQKMSAFCHLDHSFEIDVAALLSNGSWCCFNRSRLLEIILEHYRFDIRHISIFKGRHLFPHLFLPKTLSHAGTEVRTEKGWIAIDSTSSFIGIENDDVINYDDIRSRLQKDPYQFDDPKMKEKFSHYMFQGEYFYIYGLYSRSGRLFHRNRSLPVIDWQQFKYNLASDH